MNVYFISGLAADSRVFHHIRLPGHCVPVYLEWIAPFRDESLAHYASRLAAGIDTSQPFALIGLSMGGMMATEIARLHKPVALILISSIPASKHLPFYFKWARVIRMHKLIPVRLVKTASTWKRVFTNESAENKEILRAIIRDSNDQFIHWAMNAILSWRGDSLPGPYIHIHGTRDEVLPIRFTMPTHVIEGGDHLMIMNKPAAINHLLKEILAVPDANDQASS